MALKELIAEAKDIKSQGRKAGLDNPYEEGSIYYDLWENNPYTNLYYTPSFWDDLGFSNKAKDANANYQQQFDEYIASIAQMKAENDYNSPVAQVQRDKDAGLNSDLLGANGGEASAGVSHQGTLPSALNGVSPSQSTFQTMTSVLGFATSTLQQIHSIKGLIFDNSQKERDSFKDFVSFAEPAIINEYSNRFSGKSPRSWNDVKSDLQEPFYDSVHNRKMAGRAFDYALRSTKYTSSEKAYKNLISNDSAMRDYIGGYVDLAYQERMMGLKSNISRYKMDLVKNKFDSSYYSHLNPVEQAKAQNRLNKTKGWKEKWQMQFYQKLYNDWKGGADLAGLLLIGETGLLPTAQMALTNLGKGDWHNKGIKWSDNVFQGVGKLTGMW